MFTSTESSAGRLGRRFLVAGIVVPAMLLGGTSCGLVGSDDAAETESEPVEDGSNGDGSNGDGGNEDGAGGEGQEGDDGGEPASSTPEDTALDVNVRHPNGTSVKLTQLSFEGNDIMVDFEVINSGDEIITFHRGGHSSQRLRLVDNKGNEYNFVEDAETESIKLGTGESLNGTMAFLGPLDGEAEDLSLVTNVHNDDLKTHDIDEESDNTGFPGFALPLFEAEK